MNCSAKLGVIGVSLLLTTAATCGFQSQDDQELRRELRQESVATGLALAAASSWDITVIPFDGEQRDFRSEQSRQLLAFGRAGRMVVCIYRPSFLDPDH